MFSHLKLNARFVYLFIEFSASAFFSMMFVVTSLYEATVAGLTPVQLILVGTALEVSAFVFEVPTGIVADVYSRKLSIIIGYILMGIGFLIEGFFPCKGVKFLAGQGLVPCRCYYTSPADTPYCPLPIFYPIPYCGFCSAYTDR